MTKFIIKFVSKVVPSNEGYFFRMRKVGFSSVLQRSRARKFTTIENAFDMRDKLEAAEGEWYTFTIEEFEVV